MSKTNGKTPCIFQLAIKAHLMSNDRPSPEEDPHFATYLRSQEMPQTYRYLRRWMDDIFFADGLPTVHQLGASLTEHEVMKELKGKTLDQLTEIAVRAQGAKRDLKAALAAWKEVAGNEASGAEGVPLQDGSDRPADRSGVPGKGKDRVQASAKQDGSGSQKGGATPGRPQAAKSTGSRRSSTEVNRG